MSRNRLGRCRWGRKGNSGWRNENKLLKHQNHKKISWQVQACGLHLMPSDQDFLLTEREKDLILEFLFCDFDRQEHILSGSLCKGWGSWLSSQNGEKPQPLSETNYAVLISKVQALPPLTRSRRDLECTRHLCATAWYTSVLKKHIESKYVTWPLFGSRMTRKSSSPVSNLQHCKFCCTLLERGRPHSYTQTMQLKNFHQFSPKFKEQACGRTLHENLKSSDLKTRKMGQAQGQPWVVATSSSFCAAKKKKDCSESAHEKNHTQNHVPYFTSQFQISTTKRPNKWVRFYIKEA